MANGNSPELSRFEPVESTEAQATPEQLDVERELKQAMAEVVMTDEQQKLYDVVTDESVPSGQQEEAMRQLLATLPEEFRTMTAQAVDELMITAVTGRSEEHRAVTSGTRNALEAMSGQLA